MCVMERMPACQVEVIVRQGMGPLKNLATSLIAADW